MRSFTQNRHRRSIVALCCCVVLAAGLACSDSTAPDPRTTLFNRMRGTYELSVALDSFTYVFCPASSPSNPTPTCRDSTVALNGRPLHGFVTLADTVAASTYTTSTTPDMYFQLPAGTLTASACDTCSPSIVPYPAEIAIVGRDSSFELTLEPSAMLILQGQIANGEISGSAISATALGSRPRGYHTGTFIAKRQP